MRVRHLWNKFDRGKDLLLIEKKLPADFSLEKILFLSIFDLVTLYKGSNQTSEKISFKASEKREMRENSESPFFQKICVTPNEVTNQ